MTKLQPQRRNANKHTLHGTRLLEKSVQSDGWIDAQTAAADGEMISGTARLELSADKFADVEPIIVFSDGTKPVVVIRTDIPNLEDPRAKRLSIAANQIAHTDYAMDGDLLKEWGGEDEAIRAMFADSEWFTATGEGQQIDYKKEWEGMPEFQQEDKTAIKSIVVHFGTQRDIDAFSQLTGQKITEKTKFIWYPKLEIIHNGAVATNG